MSGYEIFLSMSVFTAAWYIVALTIVLLVPALFEDYCDNEKFMRQVTAIIKLIAKERLQPIILTLTVTTIILWFIFRD